VGSAVTSDGRVFVWGSSDDGVLLAEDGSGSPTPLDALAGQHVTSLSCGGHHVGVVTSAGLALTFGSNEFSALGHSAECVFRVPRASFKG